MKSEDLLIVSIVASAVAGALFHERNLMRKVRKLEAVFEESPEDRADTVGDFLIATLRSTQIAHAQMKQYKDALILGGKENESDDESGPDKEGPVVYL